MYNVKRKYVVIKLDAMVDALLYIVTLTKKTRSSSLL